MDNVISSLKWRTTLARRWLRGGDDRHWAQAHRRGAALRRRLRRLTSERETVVLSLTEHFGDIIAAEPLLRGLAERHPAAQRVMVVNRRYAPLVAAHPAVHELIEVACMSEWYLPATRTGAAAEYDLHLPGRVCGRCRTVTRPTGPADGGSICADNYYHHGALLDVFAAVSGLTPPDRRPQLHLPPSVASAVDDLPLPGKFVVIHATSNQAKRDWPREKWRELAARMRAAGQAVVEVGLAPVLPEGEARLNLCGRLSLTQTCEVIRRATGFVGIDSGPAHAANAAGVRGVVLLAHYGRFEKRMPFSGGYADGSNAAVVQYDGPIAELPVDVAWDAVTQTL